MTAAFRNMLSADRDFVVSGWSSSYRTSKTAGLISMARWAAVMHVEIGAIVDSPRAITVVAYEPGEYVQTLNGPRPFHYGFISIASEPVETRRGPMPYVLYVYVKSAFRQGRQRHGLRAGYASQLFERVGVDPRAPFVHACSTGVVSDLACKIPLSEYNPLPVRFQDEQRSQGKAAGRTRTGQHRDQGPRAGDRRDEGLVPAVRHQVATDRGGQLGE